MDTSFRGIGLGQTRYDKAIAKAKRLGGAWFSTEPEHIKELAAFLKKNPE